MSGTGPPPDGRGAPAVRRPCCSRPPSRGRSEAVPEPPPRVIPAQAGIQVLKGLLWSLPMRHSRAGGNPGMRPVTDASQRPRHTTGRLLRRTLPPAGPLWPRTAWGRPSIAVLTLDSRLRGNDALGDGGTSPWSVTRVRAASGGTSARPDVADAGVAEPACRLEAQWQAKACPARSTGCHAQLRHAPAPAPVHGGLRRCRPGRAFGSPPTAPPTAVGGASLRRSLTPVATDVGPMGTATRVSLRRQCPGEDVRPAEVSGRGRGRLGRWSRPSPPWRPGSAPRGGCRRRRSPATRQRPRSGR